MAQDARWLARIPHALASCLCLSVPPRQSFFLWIFQIVRHKAHTHKIHYLMGLLVSHLSQCPSPSGQARQGKARQARQQEGQGERKLHHWVGGPESPPISGVGWVSGNGAPGSSPLVLVLLHPF